ncbi:MAG: hypothetical protein P9L88_04250 [Candidatus Tantalella remota]|nr:hypothetical protein [Candidatus Tantalella remota]
MVRFIKLVVIFALSLQICAGGYAEEYKMSEDPRLVDALESFYQAEEYMVKGNNEFERRPGLAQKMFEHAEDYFTKAAFLYREHARIEGIDTRREEVICEKRDREAHVMVTKSRKRKRRTDGRK